MENIDKKSAIKALVEKGKAVGKLTTQEIDNAMIELDIDIEELDKLYELIEANNIELIDDLDDMAQDAISWYAKELNLTIINKIENNQLKPFKIL